VAALAEGTIRNRFGCDQQAICSDRWLLITIGGLLITFHGQCGMLD